jgi:hypothetical protein
MKRPSYFSSTEAFDQLNYLHNEHNTHRRYLAQQWWSFERAKANDYIPQVGSEWTTLADHIINEFKCISIDMNKDIEDDAKTKRMEMLRIALHNKYSCLCHCQHHRDECPTHSRQ